MARSLYDAYLDMQMNFIDGTQPMSRLVPSLSTLDVDLEEADLGIAEGIPDYMREPATEMNVGTLHEEFVKFNLDLIDANVTPFQFVPAMTALNTRIDAVGFGLPDRVPHYVLKDGKAEKRVKTLTKRYIQEDHWERGMRQIRNCPKMQGTKSSLEAATINFFRDSTKTQTPRGGGCLNSMTFYSFGKQRGVTVYMRASEVTKALTGDMYFFRYLIQKAIDDADLRWDIEAINLHLRCVYSVQKPYNVPVFLLEVPQGERELFKRMTRDPMHKWEYAVQRYFWKFTLFEERINWGPRKRLAEIFRERSTLDWHAIGLESGKFERFPDTGTHG